MKIRLTAFFALALLVVECAADFSPPPFALRAFSSDGSKVVRVEREKSAKAGKSGPRFRATVYSYDAKRDVYSVSSRFDFGEAPPSEFLFVANDAKYLVAVNIGHWLGESILGIRILDGKGTVLNRWQLGELLRDDEIEGIAKTGSTTQWFQSGQLLEDKFVFSGPATSIHGWGSSFTVMRGGDTKISYQFEIDLKTLVAKRLMPETAPSLPGETSADGLLSTKMSDAEILKALKLDPAKLEKTEISDENGTGTRAFYHDSENLVCILDSAVTGLAVIRYKPESQFQTWNLGKRR